MKHLHTLQKIFFKGTLEHYCVADYNPWYACPHKRTYSRLHSRVLLKERLRNKNQNNKKNLKCNRKWLFPGIHKTRYHSSDQLLLEFTIGARCFTLKIQWKATLTAGTVTGECFLPFCVLRTWVHANVHTGGTIRRKRKGEPGPLFRLDWEGTEG